MEKCNKCWRVEIEVQLLECNFTDSCFYDSTAARRLHVVILRCPSGPQAHGVSSTQNRVQSLLLKSWPIEHWNHMSKVTYVWYDVTHSGTCHPTFTSKKLKTKSLRTCEEMSLSHKPSKQRWHTKKLASSCKVIRVTTPLDSASGWASRDTGYISRDNKGF